MISKYMRGRLGNQLFQYATIRYVQIINGDKDSITLNFSKYVYSKNFENELKYFKIQPYTEKDNIKIEFNQKLLIIYYKIIKRIIRFISPKEYYIKKYNLEDKINDKMIKNGIYWKEDGRINILPTNKENKILIGHFECKKNFDKIRDVLLKEFEPKNKPLEKNKELYKIIKNTKSVCISIRRGDFVSNPVFSKKYNVCDEKYFKSAIEKMKKIIDNPTFIIFSDDIKWCKENLDFGEKIYFEDGTDPVWEKLRLMYSCKNFIISNSTFSWWAQYLSKNKNKVVIAPYKWSNIGYKKDIYDKDWIIVKN